MARIEYRCSRDLTFPGSRFRIDLVDQQGLQRRWRLTRASIRRGVVVSVWLRTV